MMADDDDLWLDALAGRATRDAPASREAQELRSAILSRDVRDVVAAQTDAARERTLLARARREGLVSPRRHTPHGWRLSLAAAAIVCIAFGFWVVDRSRNAPFDEAFVVRSASAGIIHIETSDPKALKQRMLTDLRAAGVDANGYERLGSEGIDADLPTVLPHDLAAVLDRYRLAPPADGVLRVEIVAPPDR